MDSVSLLAVLLGCTVREIPQILFIPNWHTPIPLGVSKSSLHLKFCWKPAAFGSLAAHNFLLEMDLLKSDNLQYNTLGRWVSGTNDSATNRLMFQAFFFHTFLQNSLQQWFQFFFLFFYNFTKIRINSFETLRNYEKYNACNIRCLVDESFVPANQQTSVLYCRLSDF